MKINLLDSDMNFQRGSQTRSTKRFGCTKCDKKFSQKSHLNRHMQIHTGHYSFRCDNCGKGFNDGTNFKLHVRTHQGLKYNCKLCSKSYYSKHRYEHHQAVHTGQYIFVCAVCGEGFNEKRLFDQHSEFHLESCH